MTADIHMAGKVYPILAGATSGAGSVLISVEFWQALIIAVVTGLLAAGGTVIGAILAARVAHRIFQPVRDSVETVRGSVETVQAGLGLTRRAEDDGTAAK